MSNPSFATSYRPGAVTEALEPRRLLAVDPAAMAARGFELIEWNGQQSYALPGQWIVRMDGINGQAKQQLQKLDALLGSVRNDLQATRLLGDDGLALIKAPRGLTHAQLKASLRGLTNVRSIEPDFALWSQATVNDPGFSQLWGLHNTAQNGGKFDADIDAPEAWDITRGNGSVVVGVIDSGVDYNHPDLAGAIWTNPGEIPGDGIDNDGNGYIDDVRGWNFLANNNNPMDDNDHGTHIAGTIAAVGNNGIGIAGVANAKILPLKFLGSDGLGSTSHAIAAINYATKLRKDHGINIRVTNNSWGGGAASTSLQNAITAHRDAGIMFVAAAGNGGSDYIGDNNDISPYWPSNYNYSNVIAVAATDRNDQLAGFSNYGANSVHVAAPGESIYSTLRNGGYGLMNGTSMAAPHVAGVVALAWSLTPAATVQQVRDAVLQGVDVVSSLYGKVASNGRVNAHQTLRRLLPAEQQRRPYLGSPFAVGSSPITIQAEHYDVGGQNLTYRDTTSGNNPGSFRTGEDVDIRWTGDAGGGHRITGTVAGEWTEYSISVAEAGTYRLDLRASCASSGSRARVLLDGSDITGAISVPNTGGWDTLTTLSRDVTLPAGQHILRLVTDAHSAMGEGGSYNWIRLTRLTTSQTPPPPTTSVETIVRSTNSTNVRGGSYASSNFGQSTFIAASLGDASNTRDIYIGFDLAAVATTSSARLRLFGKLSAAGSLTFNVHSSDSTSWTENTLTWNNRPAVNAPVLGSFTVARTTDQWYDIDLTSFIQNRLAAGNKKLTLVIRGAFSASPFGTFASDETTSAPQLVLRS